MHTASMLVFLVGRAVSGPGATLVIVSIAALLVALAGAVWIGDLLQPASEPIVAAPLRWR